MDKEPVLTIKRKKYSGPTTVISVRLAKDLVRDIDRLADATGRTRNELLNASLEFAIRHMQVVTDDPES